MEFQPPATLETLRHRGKETNNAPCLRASNDQREWVVKKRTQHDVKESTRPIYTRLHSGSYIQSELDNPIYAAGNPRITSNPKPTG